MLLPLKLDLEDGIFADCAAVVRLNVSQDSYNYVMRTVFPIPLAFNYARVISEVREQWLLQSLSRGSLHTEKHDEPAILAPVPQINADLYTIDHYKETIHAIKVSSIPHNKKIMADFETECETFQPSLDDYARVIVLLRPNWKLTYCKYRGAHTELHARKPHLCAFAHTEIEKNFWDGKRVQLQISSRHYHDINANFKAS